MTFKQFCDNLEAKIIQSYEQGVTILEAERLAGEFLAAQIRVSEELLNIDLDARMKKSGVKSIRASMYLQIVQKSDKKPTEGQITAMLDSDNTVLDNQALLDEAEVTRDSLERYYSIFQNAHLHFRNISKGKYE